MFTGYGDFAEVYDRHYGWYSHLASEPIARFLDEHIADAPKTLVDVGCGTGELALIFGSRGYQVTGLDISPQMISVALAKVKARTLEGQVTFMQADATNFELAEPVSAATAIFDSLNHLENWEALASCFRSVRRAVRDDGVFVFDMLTRAGIRAFRDELVTSESDFYFRHATGDPTSNELYNQIFVFTQAGNGCWNRYETSVRERTWPMQDVMALVTDSGWSSVRAVVPTNLSIEAGDAEAGDRAIMVAEA